MEVEKPAVFKRKVAKDYGGKKMVEGIFKANDRALLIEDVVVYASGLIEAAEVIFFVNFIKFEIQINHLKCKGYERNRIPRFGCNNTFGQTTRWFRKC